MKRIWFLGVAILVMCLYPPFYVQVTNVTLMYGNSEAPSTIQVTSNTSIPFSCTTSVSRPTATIVWYIGTKEKQRSSTSSTFMLTPQNSEHDKQIFCKAFNIQQENKAVSSNKANLYVQVQVTNVTLMYGNSEAPPTIQVTSNTSIPFSCTTSVSRPTATIVWYIGTEEKQRSSTSSTFIFTPQNSDHDKQIFCRAFNIQQESKAVSSNKAKLYVQVGPDIVNISVKSPIGFTEGDIAQDIRCSAECYPGCSYIWTNVTDSSRISSNNVLSLRRVNRFMTGSYMCTVNNTSPQYPHTAENIIEVIVTYTDVQSFYIKEHPGQDNVTVDEHDAIIEFRCVVYSNTASKTKVMFEGNLIKEGVNVTTLSAIRQDISCYDAGVYTCEGINDNGKISSKKVLLSVRCVPRPRDQVQRNVTSEVYSTITLSFTAIAYPEPNPKGFAWHKDEDVGWVPLLSNNHLKISSSALQSNLSVLNVSKEDYGNYRVTVTNDIGTYVQHFILYGKMSPDHTNSQCNCQQSEQTALIVAIILGVVCCVLASVAFYLNILRMRTYAKDEGSLSRQKKHSTYDNRSFASNVVERHEYENPVTGQGEASNEQQYTDLSRYANTDKDTYDVIRKT